MDFMKTIYNRIGLCELVWEPLVGFDKNLELMPLEAESWDKSADGLTWTFHLRKGLLWSDGEPLTANDFVFALRRAVTQGYDFGWYWSWAAGIKNWSKVEKGTLPVEELGIKAPDNLTLVITTETPKPFLPGVLVWLYPVPKHAVDKYGDEYATKAETMVSNSPFIVSEWVKQDHITYVRNPNYKGILKPYLSKIVTKYGTENPETGFPAYLNNEIYKSELNPGQLAYAQKNIPMELHSAPSFAIFYLTFDTTKPPFNDVRVRKAFNYAVNRDEMCSTVLKGLASPEWQVLMKGFPGHDPEAKKLSDYNPASARKLLAEAGYPDGKGFPKLELYLRQGPEMAIQKPAGEYLQAQLKKNLGIEIVPLALDMKTYTDALNKHTHNFFLAPYAFDYTDPSNFMDLFLTGGRHAWSNAEYDKLVKEGDSTWDWGKRLELYHKAQKLLIEEAPAVFMMTQTTSNVWKSFIKGPGVEPNKSGIVIWDWMYYLYILSNIYIAQH
ncbi:MAG: peptide ABC transporter substrate-binding protein [Spirochaetota bacterium]